MITRPIVILPPSLSDPDELMTVSPSSLRGPSDSTWTSLGAGGDYPGQQALQASLLKRFRKYWKLYYAQRLQSNCQTAETGSFCSLLNWLGDFFFLLQELFTSSLFWKSKLSLLREFQGKLVV